jgi:hypothetical protein
MRRCAEVEMGRWERRGLPTYPSSLSGLAGHNPFPSTQRLTTVTPGKLILAARIYKFANQELKQNELLL